MTNPIAEPEIRKTGETTIEAIVNLDMGFGTIAGMTKFAQEAKKYNRMIYVRNVKNDESYDLKFINSALMAGVLKGEKIEFIINGVDKEAERIALRLYSGATSERSYDPDFERYENKAKKPDSFGCPWAYSE